MTNTNRWEKLEHKDDKPKISHAGSNLLVYLLANLTCVDILFEYVKNRNRWFLTCCDIVTDIETGQPNDWYVQLGWSWYVRNGSHVTFLSLSLYRGDLSLNRVEGSWNDKNGYILCSFHPPVCDLSHYIREGYGHNETFSLKRKLWLKLFSQSPKFICEAYIRIL